MPFQLVSKDIYRWSDVCNVYAIKRGDSALLVDLGDGSVLSKLGEIGAARVEWVLFTHHHREQCQGAALLKGWEAKIAVPAAERAFFEQPLSFRKMRPTLEDAFSVYGASYVRPPIEPIHADRTFARMDDFVWQGLQFICLHAGGNSPGHMAYLLQTDDGWIAFAGDLMLENARMHTWYDTEWDYGFAKGIYELGNSAALVAGYDPAFLCPSHGSVIPRARDQLLEYVAKLRKLAELYVRGYDIQRFAACDQDTVSLANGGPACLADLFPSI